MGIIYLTPHPRNVDRDGPSGDLSGGAGAPDVTDEMISAGLAEIDGFDLQEAWESQSACIDLISKVYRAMLLARPTARIMPVAEPPSARSSSAYG